MRTLVADWFTFEQMGATAGDLVARDVACDWLERAGHPYDVALAPPFSGGVDWRLVDPQSDSHGVFVCGPFGNGWPLTAFLPRFAGCRFVGPILSMFEPLDGWNPVSFLLERDISARAHPDIYSQPEYKGKDIHRVANDSVHRFVVSRKMSVVPIDTCLDSNSTGLRSAAEVESLIARMDLVMTTRLHGMVIALKNGVPAIAIDLVARGRKIRRQAKTLGWAVALTADALTDEALQRAFDYCLTKPARTKAKDCCVRARKAVWETQDEFISALAHSGERTKA
jgi:hypothetical protein